MTINRLKGIVSKFFIKSGFDADLIKIIYQNGKVCKFSLHSVLLINLIIFKATWRKL